LGALNFLDLDDIEVLKEGEPVDPRSVVVIPLADGRPLLPDFERSPQDPFLRQLEGSGKKWIILVDRLGSPQVVLNVHRFLRDVFFGDDPIRPEAYWHIPIVITEPNVRLGEVLGLMKARSKYPGDDLIDHDVILVWTAQKRIITGADLLGRLLRGIARSESEIRKTTPATRSKA
jgi:metal transporter CNNM